MVVWYFDHNVSQPLASLLRDAGHTITTAREVGLDAAKDERHLLFAAERQWTFCTTNKKDFRLLHDAWLRWSRAWNVTSHHAGIVIFPNAWDATRAMQELEAFIALDLSLTNALYEWQSRDGWQRRPLPPD